MKYQITEFFPWGDGSLPASFEEFIQSMKKLSSSNRPFFLFTHLFLPRYIQYDPGVAPSLEEYPAPYGPEKKSRVEKSKRSYDRAVSDIDGELGRFFDTLTREGLLQNTIFIITADHGEAFDKGFWGHGDDLSEDSIKVPLFIIVPKGEKKTIEDAVQSCDIPPTILSLLGFEKPEWMDCNDATKKSQRLPITFNFLTKTAFRESDLSVSIYKNSFKLIRHPINAPELYNLSFDPHENFNLATTSPEKLQELSADLNQILGK